MTRHTRRTILAAIAAGGVGVSVSQLFAGRSAAATAAVDISQDDITVKSGDQTLNQLTVAPTGTVKWDRVDAPVHEIALHIETAVDGATHEEDSRVQPPWTGTFDVPDPGRSGRLSFAQDTAVRLWVGQDSQTTNASAQAGDDVTYDFTLEYDVRLRDSDGTVIQTIEGSESFAVTLDVAGEVSVSGNWHADASA